MINKTKPIKIIYLDQMPCAVKNCERQPFPQMCFYDGRIHHHGRIHYQGETQSNLTFRDEWLWLCDHHYKILKNKHIS